VIRVESSERRTTSKPAHAASQRSRGGSGAGLNGGKMGGSRSKGTSPTSPRAASRWALLLVPSALQQLSLLVLSHLLAALLDHTTHWMSPYSAPSAPACRSMAQGEKRGFDLPLALPSAEQSTRGGVPKAPRCLEAPPRRVKRSRRARMRTSAHPGIEGAPGPHGHRSARSR